MAPSASGKGWYRTEDGVTVHTGDRAYDYYSMKPGVVGRDIDGTWFEFNHDDGTINTLDGSRICSMSYAVRRGFRDANEIEKEY